MALDSSNCNPSFYAFGSSSSPHHHHQADLEVNGQVGLTKGNAPQFLRLHQMMQGGGGAGKVLSDSNDGSLISFEDSFEAAAGGYHNSTSRRPNDSHQTASSLDSHILAMYDHQKHPNMDDEKPPNKKQCTNNKSKAKPVASKDPQSIAAKNRRERISERLKILQELVPNGTKVDLVTMLEKAIGYVKFLQLQVKVLAADEFWPVQGGKAPELSQVKDAIDAILSSQKSDRNSPSN